MIVIGGGAAGLATARQLHKMGVKVCGRMTLSSIIKYTKIIIIIIITIMLI